MALFFVLSFFSVVLFGQSHMVLTDEVKAYIDQRLQEERQAFKEEQKARGEFSYGGYFRAGSNYFGRGGATNSGACYALSHPPRNDGIFFRLGNECRDYGEFNFGFHKQTNGIEYKTMFTFDIASDSRQARGVEPWAMRERQMYIEFTGAFLGQSKLWVGRRFYRAIGHIGDIHLLDGFQMQSSGNGFGLSHVNFLAGTYHFALFGYGQSDVDNNIDDMNKFLDIRSEYTLGEAQFQIGVQHLLADEVRGTRQAVDGSTLTLQWKQRLVGFIDHVFIVQQGSGSMAQNPGCFGSDGNCFNHMAGFRDEGIRFIESATMEFSPALKLNLLGLFEESDQYGKMISVGFRPHYALTDYISLLAEFSSNEFQRIEQANSLDRQQLFKSTLALQVTPDATNFWQRPSMRLYLSGFEWNKAAGLQSQLERGSNANAKDAIVYGVQGEVWF